MFARKTLPAEVACIGVRCPTQLTVGTIGEPVTWDDPWRARTWRIETARFTDCTEVPRSTRSLGIAQRYCRQYRRRSHIAGRDFRPGENPPLRVDSRQEPAHGVSYSSTFP